MAKKKNATARFAGFPFVVLRSRNYARLSNNARALLIEMRLQFNGYNNGALRATFSMMKQRGWTSKETLNYGLQELLHYGLIECIRKGKRCGGTHFPSLYALTWEPIHANPAEGVSGRLIPSNTWKQDCPKWERPKRPKKSPGTKSVPAKYGKRSCPSTVTELRRKSA